MNTPPGINDQIQAEQPVSATAVKPYQTPKLQPLGPIHSLVQQLGGHGADGGGDGDNHS